MTARPLQSLSLRQAIITRLRGDADLIAIGTPPLSEGDRIYEQSPANLTWPFIRYGAPGETPLRKGSEVSFSIHTFSKTQFTDETAALNAAAQTSLEDAVIDLGGGRKAYVTWGGSQILPDPAEASAHHGVNSFNATIA